MAIDTTPTGRLRQYRHAKQAMGGLLVVGMLLMVAGFCIPGWVVTSEMIRSNEHEMQRGLWYFIYCVNDHCDTRPFTALDEYPFHFKLHKDGLVEYQVEATLALVCSILAFALLICYFRAAFHFNKSILLLSVAVVSLVSSAMALLAVGRIGDATIKEADFYGDRNPFYAPYSVILYGVAGVFLFLVFFIYVCIMCCCSPVTSEVKRVSSKRKNNPPYPYTVPSHEKVVITEKRVVHPGQEKVIVTESRAGPAVIQSYGAYEYQEKHVAAPRSVEYHSERVSGTPRSVEYQSARVSGKPGSVEYHTVSSTGQPRGGVEYHTVSSARSNSGYQAGYQERMSAPRSVISTTRSQVRDNQDYDVSFGEPYHVKLQIIPNSDGVTSERSSTAGHGYTVY